MKHIVLGGGISGLSAAYYLSKSFLKDIKIYESSNRIGGWIKTIKKKNGVIFEQGPRTLRAKGDASLNTLQLIDELGLSSSVRPIPVTHAAAKNRMIFLNDELINLPFKFGCLFKIDPPFIKPLIYGIMKDLMAPKVVVEDESIYDFTCRRFGEDYAENLVSPLICGIFGGDAKEISVKSIMDPLFQKEQKYGSVILGAVLSAFKQKKNINKTNLKIRKKIQRWSVWSLKNGLETLPIHLHKYLAEKNIDILLEHKCSNLEFKNSEVLVTVNGKVETAQHLYSSLPSKSLANILGDDHSFLKSELLSIPFVSIGIVNLEYDGDLLPSEGFGFLVPPNQKIPILGITFDSCIFSQEGKTVLTVMMGGRWFEEYFGSNPDKKSLLDVAKKYVNLILNIEEEPADSLVTILKEAIPQYVVGHSKRVKGIREYIKKNKLPLTLLGNSYDGVGVNDAILSAKNNVENTLKDLNLNISQNKTTGNQ